MFQSTDEDPESMKSKDDMNVGQIQNYLKKSSYNQICGGLELDVGISEFNDFHLRVEVDKMIYKNKVPDENKMLLGYPLAYLNFIEHEIRIQK